MKIFRQITNSIYFYPFLILLFSIPLVLPLLQQGFYPFHDEPQIANLHQMVRSLSLGQFPPRWAPDFTYGYGYPFFNFYYHLPFYLGAIFHFLFGLNLVWSLKLVFLLSLPLSGLTFYFMMRRWFGRLASFTGAIVYLLTPYRAVDVYVRGAVGEMWAFVFIPLVIGSLYDCLIKKNNKSILLAGLAVAGLMLTHNLTAIIILPSLFVFLLIISLITKTHFSNIFHMVKGYLLGFAISAYYWIPALLEKKYIKSGTPFDPIDHFPFIKQLLIPSWGYGASLPGMYDGMSFQIGIVNLMVMVMMALFFFVLIKRINRNRKTAITLLYLCLGIVLFLMNIRSYFLWQLLPLGDYIQFPWRLLMLTTLISSVLVGFIDEIKKVAIKRGVLLMVILLAVILNVKYFRMEKQVLVGDDFYLKRFFANQISTGKTNEVSGQYKNFSEDYLPLTIWNNKKPIEMPRRRVEISSGVLTFDEISPIKYFISSSSTKPASLVFNIRYFPGWTGHIDNKQALINPLEPYGNMSIDLPAGNHQVLLELKQTGIQMIGSTISLVVLVLYLVFLLFVISSGIKCGKIR